MIGNSSSTIETIKNAIEKKISESTFFCILRRLMLTLKNKLRKSILQKSTIFTVISMLLLEKIKRVFNKNSHQENDNKVKSDSILKCLNDSRAFTVICQISSTSTHEILLFRSTHNIHNNSRNG